MKYLFISFNLKLFLNFFTMPTIFVIGPINFFPKLPVLCAACKQPTFSQLTWRPSLTGVYCVCISHALLSPLFYFPVMLDWIFCVPFIFFRPRSWSNTLCFFCSSNYAYTMSPRIYEKCQFYNMGRYCNSSSTVSSSRNQKTLPIVFLHPVLLMRSIMSM